MIKLRLFKMALFSMLFVSNFILAQNSITGNVSDGSAPLPGVTVMEKGTTNGTVTDFDGNFTLTVAD
ncbi:MAG: carboxypeptidase-like regulatory domain-containing protein, partial [Flavobacteriaceae bacterium]